MHYVGIDWADKSHQICLQTEDGQIISELEIKHNWKGFEELQTLLETVQPVEINLERGDGLLVDWLVGQGWPVFVTPPRVAASRRPRKSKDDRGDAYLLANLRRLKDEDCRPLVIQSEIVETLKPLLRAYDQLKKQQVKNSNQLRQVLKLYYPTAEQAFSSLTGPVALAFLETYPTPEAARSASYEELRTFLKQSGYTCMKYFDRLYQRLNAPAPTARVPAGHATHMLALVPVLRVLHQQLKAVKKEVEAVFSSHPEATWWRSFPGIGPLTAARLLAYIGDNREGFPTVETLQTTAGTVPITRRSGKQILVQFRWECSKPLRKAAMDMAQKSIRDSGWARSYFYAQRGLGHDKIRAYRALANRWMRIIWTLWQRGETYNEAKHVANRSRKGLKVAALAKAS